jgi:hypothetical protein
MTTKKRKHVEPWRCNTMPTDRSCLDCVFHSAPILLGEPMHLCILPPDCAPLAERDDDFHWHDEDNWDRTYLGTSCDVMRRMGAACGPRAAMWCSADAPARLASSVVGDSHA